MDAFLYIFHLLAVHDEVRSMICLSRKAFNLIFIMKRPHNCWHHSKLNATTLSATEPSKNIAENRSRWKTATCTCQQQPSGCGGAQQNSFIRQQISRLRQHMTTLQTAHSMSGASARRVIQTESPSIPLPSIKDHCPLCIRPIPQVPPCGRLPLHCVSQERKINRLHVYIKAKGFYTTSTSNYTEDDMSARIVH